MNTLKRRSDVRSCGDASNGAIAVTYEYGPFGEALRQTGPMANENPLRFRGWWSGRSVGSESGNIRDWADYEHGHKRYQLTHSMSSSALNEFREYVRANGGCKCKKYYGVE